jgi:hypothetical protein
MDDGQALGDRRALVGFNRTAADEGQPEYTSSRITAIVQTTGDFAPRLNSPR